MERTKTLFLLPPLFALFQKRQHAGVRSILGSIPRGGCEDGCACFRQKPGLYSEQLDGRQAEGQNRRNYGLDSERKSNIIDTCACSSAGLERRSPEPKVARSNRARRTIHPRF
jgi:hypothetical protein